MHEGCEIGMCSFFPSKSELAFEVANKDSTVGRQMK